MHPMCCRVRSSVWREHMYPVQCWNILCWRREHVCPMLCRVHISVGRELMHPVQRRDVLSWSNHVYTMRCRVHINVWRKLVHPVQRWHLLSWRREHLHPMLCRELLSHLRRILLHPLRSRQRIGVWRELVCPVQRRDVLGWRHAVYAVQRRVLLPASWRRCLHPVPRHSRICCWDQRGGGVHLPCGLAAVLRLRVRVQRRIPPSEQRDRPGAVQLRHLRLQQDCKFFIFDCDCEHAYVIPTTRKKRQQKTPTPFLYLCRYPTPTSA